MPYVKWVTVDGRKIVSTRKIILMGQFIRDNLRLVENQENIRDRLVFLIHFLGH